MDAITRATSIGSRLGSAWIRSRMRRMRWMFGEVSLMAFAPITAPRVQISVWKAPGSTSTTLMPRELISRRSDSLQPSMACLEAQ